MAARPLDETQIRTSLARFRVASIVEGIALLILVAIMVMRYVVYPDATPGGEHDLWTAVSKSWSPIHGLIYMVYVVLGFDLWNKMRWPFGRMLLLMLFGVVPVLSFFGERWTTSAVEKDLRERPTLADEVTGDTRL